MSTDPSAAFERLRTQCRFFISIGNLLQREVESDCLRADAVMSERDARDRVASISPVLAGQVWTAN